MAILDPLRRILNNTPGTATDIDYNFQTLESFANVELINRDGSVAMQAPLTGVPATQDDHYVTRAQAVGTLPVGMMVDWGTTTPPANWLLCDGAAYSSTDPQYQALFAVIGYSYGDAGGGNFNVPDFRARAAYGFDATSPPFDTLGGVFDDQADAELIQHTHVQDAHGHTLSGGVSTSASHSHSTGSDSHVHSGPSHAHNLTSASTNFWRVGGAVSGSAGSIMVFGDYSGRNNIGTESTVSGGTGNTGSDSHSHSVSGGSHSHGDTFAVVNTTAVNQNAGTMTVLENKNYPPGVVVTKIIFTGGS